MRSQPDDDASAVPVETVQGEDNFVLVTTPVRYRQLSDAAIRLGMSVQDFVGHTLESAVQAVAEGRRPWERT